MSARASFASQWFYCEQCRDALRAATEAWIDLQDIEGGDGAGGSTTRIIAGKLGGLGARDVLRRAEMIAEAAAQNVCHSVVFTVVTEDLKVLVYHLAPGQPQLREVVDAPEVRARLLARGVEHGPVRDVPGERGADHLAGS